MKYLYYFTAVAVVISFLCNKQKTYKAFKVAVKKLKKILPQFVIMLIFVSITLYLIPEATITKYLSGSNIIITTAIAALIGSITMMPGFIAFPLCGILLKNGVSYTTVAAFSTTLMLVGILTYPVEKQYFGTKLTIVRNLVSFVIAILIALAIGLSFGEII